MDSIKHFINIVSAPRIMFTMIVASFFFIFPPTEWFSKWNKRLRINLLWTNAGGIGLFAALLLLFAFGLTDPNFRLIVLKPDNVPIVGLLFLVVFFLWLSMK